MTSTKEELLKLADKFKEAGWGNVDITPSDLAVLGLPPKAPASFTPKGQKWAIKPAEGWDDFCAWVYESVTGEAFKGSDARGRGFRSQENGEKIAAMLRTRAGNAIDYFNETFSGDVNQGIVALCQFIDKTGRLDEFKAYWKEREEEDREGQ